HPNLTMLHLAQRATILPRDPHRVLAFFDETCLVEHQDAIGIAHPLGDELMVVPPYLFLIPDDITDKPLQPPDGALSSVGFSLMPLWEAVGRHGADRQPSRDCSATILGV